MRKFRLISVINVLMNTQHRKIIFFIIINAQFYISIDPRKMYFLLQVHADSANLNITLLLHKVLSYFYFNDQYIFIYGSYQAAVIKSKGLSLEARAEWIHCQ